MRVPTTESLAFADLGGDKREWRPEGDRPGDADETDEDGATGRGSDEESEEDGESVGEKGEEPGSTEGERGNDESGEMAW